MNEILNFNAILKRIKITEKSLKILATPEQNKINLYKNELRVFVKIWLKV
jgi:hypothetical protein